MSKAKKCQTCEECEHDWVRRLDGYEEQCGPAICRKCGKYGCYCDAKWALMDEKSKDYFETNAINGNSHELEKKLQEPEPSGEVLENIDQHIKRIEQEKAEAYAHIEQLEAENKDQQKALLAYSDYTISLFSKRLEAKDGPEISKAHTD